MKRVAPWVGVVVAVALALPACGKSDKAGAEGEKAAAKAGEAGKEQPAAGLPKMPATPEEAARLSAAPALPPGTTEMPPGHPPIGGMAAGAGEASGGGGAAGSGDVSGTVLDTMDAGGYTYVQVKTDKAEVWMAGPATRLAKGDRVVAVGSMVMHDFHSKTLNRTFPEILFVGKLEVVKP
jgi:hypothetical protein